MDCTDAMMAASAPALGADGAALVGRAVHAERTREAATRLLQAAWRRRQAWRAYLRRAAARLCQRWFSANYAGMMQTELSPPRRAFMELALRGGRVVATWRE